MREGAGWFYTDRVDAADWVCTRWSVCGVSHERWARIPWSGRFIYRSATAIGAGREQCSRRCRRHESCLTSARWPTKRWPPEHYAEIGRRATAEYGAGLIAVGSAVDRPFVDALLRRSEPGSVLDLCGGTRLLQLAAIAVESDLMHLQRHGTAASGCRRRCPRRRDLYLHQSTAHRPVRSPVRTVQTCVWCAASLLKKCDRLECMSELTPARVWPVVKTELETCGRRIAQPQGLLIREEESTGP